MCCVLEFPSAWEMESEGEGGGMNWVTQDWRIEETACAGDGSLFVFELPARKRSLLVAGRLWGERGPFVVRMNGQTYEPGDVDLIGSCWPQSAEHTQTLRVVNGT